MSKPRRIQRKRTKGWKLPPNAVYVGRPTKWGNSFRRGQLDADGKPMTAERAVALYRFCVGAKFGKFDKETYGYTLYPDTFDELRGKDLACWCPLDKPCHADVLLELANQE